MTDKHMNLNMLTGEKQAVSNPVEVVVMWIGRDKAPKCGAKVKVKRKMFARKPNNPLHPGHKTGEWEEETVYGGTNFACDLLSSGYVTEWRYI